MVQNPAYRDSAYFIKGVRKSGSEGAEEVKRITLFELKNAKNKSPDFLTF